MYRFSYYAKIYFLLLLFYTCIILFYLQLQYYYQQKPVTTNIIVKSSIKYVLYWTPFWNRKDYYLGYGLRPYKNCQYKNCFATADRNYKPVENFDALIFHGAGDMDIPLVRKFHQYYIYMNCESPAQYPVNLKPYKSFFNWTMSYRFDSDIVKRFGLFQRRHTPYLYELPTQEAMNRKKKLIAWFVSNCNTSSKREILVKELEKFTTVDVYGACGNLKCKRKGKKHISSDACYAMLEENYKFYLSFENSYCKDYATEKLYYLLKRDIVPVVYGGADYSICAPPYSVINVEDFASVSDLVTYLKFLDQNDETYLEYFKWKKLFYIFIGFPYINCKICEKLNKQQPSVYHDLNKWFWGENNSTCKFDTQLPNIVRNLL